MSDRPSCSSRTSCPPIACRRCAPCTSAGLEVAIFDGRRHHATGGVNHAGVPHQRVSQRGVYRLAASRRYRAVIATSAGRLALPPRSLTAAPVFRSSTRRHLASGSATPAHLLAIPLMRSMERFGRRHDRLWRAPSPPTPAGTARATSWSRRRRSTGGFLAATVRPSRPRRRTPPPATPRSSSLYAGRAEPEKGVGVLLDAWAATGADAPGRGACARRGVRRDVPAATGVVPLGQLAPEQLRNLYAAADVVVGAIGAHASLPRTVGAGGQRGHVPAHSRHRHRRRRRRSGRARARRRTGLVVPASDPAALAAAITALARGRGAA